MDNKVLAAALRAAAAVLDPITDATVTQGGLQGQGVEMTPAMVALIAETTKETVKPAKPKAAKAAAPVTNVEALVTAPTAATPAVVAPAAATAASPTNVIAPPTDIQATAIAFKTLVTSKGRAAGVALLGTFGATLMSQIPPAKLAEFKVACDKGAQAPDAPAVEDPTAGLLN